MLAAIVASVSAGHRALGAQKARAPNILLILADDLGAECLGCYGGRSYRTPRLDQLAATGVRFDRCYALPVCSPSRAELLTGRYVFRTGVTHVILPKAPGKLDVKRDRTLAWFLREAGYATCIAGKWHLCLDFADNPRHVADAGFDDRYLWRLFRSQAVQRHFWNPELWVDDRPADALGRGKFGDDLFTDHVLRFIRQHRDRPFFVYYPMTLVHSQTATGGNYPAAPDTIRPGADPDAGVEPRQKGFADLVAYTDTLVGRIVDGLDELGLRRSTLVVFAGDNGTDRRITSQLGDRLLRGGKTTLTEAGTRVPLVVRWPGSAPVGSVVSDLVDFSDFLPTLLDAAGAPLPAGYAIDGRSFLPQVRGKNGRARPWVYRQLGKSWVIRTPTHRLDSDGRLWDLADDAYRPVLAAPSPETAAVRQQLSAAVERLHASAPARPSPEALR